MRTRTILLSVLVPASISAACADEIVLKQEFGGEKIKCEIYKEDDKYIHYIDIKKKMAAGCSKEIIAKITREDKPLIDVAEFFRAKAKEARNAQAREKILEILKELKGTKTGPATRTGRLADGSYKAAARGYEGNVEVEVVVKAGKISAVKVLKHKESQPGKALEKIPARIVEKQKAEVDAVTGATITSKAIMSAAAKALKAAHKPPAPFEKVPDGSYRAAAKGYEGPLNVEVSVKDGRITAVKVVKHKESRPEDSLSTVPARIVAEQKTSVDAVTGATATSKAIMKAAAQALKTAGKKKTRKPKTPRKPRRTRKPKPAEPAEPGPDF
jgi:uncharacterized protein with FMN-binding domain